MLKNFGQQAAIDARGIVYRKGKASFDRRGRCPQFPRNPRIEGENIARSSVDFDQQTLRGTITIERGDPRPAGGCPAPRNRVVAILSVAMFSAYRRRRLSSGGRFVLMRQLWDAQAGLT